MHPPVISLNPACGLYPAHLVVVQRYLAPVKLSLDLQGYDDDESALLAAMTITMVPTLAIYILFQRRLESGLTAGALKG